MQSFLHALVFALSDQNQCLRPLTGDKQRRARGDDVVEVGRNILSEFGQTDVGQGGSLLFRNVQIYVQIERECQSSAQAAAGLPRFEIIVLTNAMMKIAVITSTIVGAGALSMRKLA